MIRQVDSSFLELKNVTKIFGGLTAVSDFTTSVQKGELVSIIGPNGAGKTTFLNIITKVLPITHGEIWFKGQRIDKLEARQIFGLGISRTFQHLELFNNMSVVENVMIGCHKWMHSTYPEVMLRLRRVRKEEREVFERAMEKLSFLCLVEKAHDMPSSLALKERKLLGIARAIASEPDLLLIDEPVGGLTIKEIDEIGKKILAMVEQGITILFIEHRMELVMGISERVIVMNFGQKIAEGSPEEIQRNEQVITAYLGKEESRV
jgi:branched-chain amino acid transport system ATP-binding protein